MLPDGRAQRFAKLYGIDTNRYLFTPILDPLAPFYLQQSGPEQVRHRRRLPAEGHVLPEEV